MWDLSRRVEHVSVSETKVRNQWVVYNKTVQRIADTFILLTAALDCLTFPSILLTNDVIWKTFYAALFPFIRLWFIKNYMHVKLSDTSLGVNAFSWKLVCFVQLCVFFKKSLLHWCASLLANIFQRFLPLKSSNELQHEIIYRLSWTHIKDSDGPTHFHSLISLFCSPEGTLAIRSLIEKTGKTVRLSKLIWIITGYTCHKVSFLASWLTLAERQRNTLP